MPPTLIIISGLPCTGKTTIANGLAQRLHLPLFSKDAVKELLFDTLGWSERKWSRKLSYASNQLLLHLADQLLIAGVSALIESNFSPTGEGPQFRDVLQFHGARILEIHCHAPPEIILERFRQRVASSARHPGHVDADFLPILERQLANSNPRPLGLGEMVIELDTSAGDVNYAILIETIGFSG